MILTSGCGRPACAQTGGQCYRTSSATPQGCATRSGRCARRQNTPTSASFVDGVADPLEDVVGMPDTVHDGEQAHLAVVRDQGRGLRLVEIEPAVDGIRGVVGAVLDVATA